MSKSNNIKSEFPRAEKKMLPCLGPCGKPFRTTVYTRVCKMCRHRLKGADDPEYNLKLEHKAA